MVVRRKDSKLRGTKRPSPSLETENTSWDTVPSKDSMHTWLNIPFAHFALIYMDNTGGINVSASPSIQQQSGAIFTRDLQQKFIEALERKHGRQGFIARKPSNTGYAHEFSHEHPQGWPSPRPAKRSRRSSSIETVPPCPTANTIPIRIGDSEKIRAFYETGFKQFQQAGCRLLAKEWVKCIQPKKQVKYAYKQGEKSKPSWWPRHVIHKEPDHLKTPARVDLMIHILCNLGGIHIPVEQLKDCAEGVRRRFPPTARIGALNEIFRVRELQERFENGEVDADTIVYVNQDAASMNNSNTLDDPEEVEDEEAGEELLTPALTPQIPIPSIPHPITGGDRNQLYPMISSYGSEEPRPETSFSTSPPVLYNDISSPETIPNTPASSAMESPHTLPVSTYAGHGTFVTLPAEDQFQAAHRPTTLPLQQPANAVSWEPTFRQNIFSNVDYNPSQAMPQQHMAYSMSMAVAPHVPELHQPMQPLPFRTGSLGHPHPVSSRPNIDSLNPTATGYCRQNGTRRPS